MKAGMEPGMVATVEGVVTEEMVAQFAGQVIHPVLSTAMMVYYMEWGARQIILPYLEDWEEGMGRAVSVQHIAPAPIGTSFRAVATLQGVKQEEREAHGIRSQRTTQRASLRTQVDCQVKVWAGERLLGEGEVVQMVVAKAFIEERLRAMEKE
ncbi:thioesterase family protein [Rubeoparvulum massiliense]|uniref:thioesterase family protein n=1 Tax=Rubeoparvulum massiliense TaxID=1631346 RepID=UPI00069FB7B5|nr:hypothetical protein [Rubeoparvulum massiliense]